MTGYENKNTSNSFEQQPGDLITEYQDTLRTHVQRYNLGMETVVSEHERDLRLFLEEDDFSQRGKFTEMLNTTNSAVSIGAASIRSETDALFERSNTYFTEVLSGADRQYWDRIQEEVEEAKETERAQGTAELPSKILGLRKQLDHYPDPEARELIKAGFDYHLQEAIRIVFRREGLGSVTESLLAVASSPEAEASMRTGLDQTVWQRIHRQAIKSGPDAPTFLASLDNASTPKVRAAMRAGLDYQVWKAVQERQRAEDRGAVPPRSIESALVFATPLARKIIYQELHPEQRKGQRDSRGSQSRYGQDPGGGFFGDFRDERFGDPFGRAREEAFRRKAGPRNGSASSSQGRQSQSGPNSRAGQEPPRSEQPPQPDLTSPDPYAVLGISRNASEEEIKKAYRELAREHHTDTGGADLETIKAINNAHDMVGDPHKRAYYDRYGHLKGYKKPA